MSQLNTALALIGGLVLATSLATGVLRSKSYLPSEPLVAVGFGVLIGPVGLDLLRLADWGPPLVLLEQVARLTVAVAVTSIALRLPPTYYWERRRSLAVVLGPVFAVMWLSSTFVAALALPVGLHAAAVLGAVVTPTDPVLANSIVVGETAEESVPGRVRYLLSGEAGANDGAAYPLVLLAIALGSGPIGETVPAWLRGPVLWEVGGALALGVALGGATGRIERWGSERGDLEVTSVFTVTVAMTFAVLGLTKVLGTDGILAVFVAGVAYNWQADPSDEVDEQRVEEVFNRLFTLPVFVLFGTVLPWGAWAAFGWRGVALVVGVLLLRRLPVVLPLGRFVPALSERPAAPFVGWFGPIGVAAIFYATLVVRRAGLDVVWTAASLVVAGSIVAHGTTATPLTHRYGAVEDGR